MDWAALYHFLFETFAGIGTLIGAGIVLSLIASVIMERRTRKTFVDRAPSKDDWSLFDDDEEDEEGESDGGSNESAATKPAAKKPAAPAKKKTTVIRAAKRK